MPTTLTELPPRVDPPRKRWTRAEVERRFAADPGGERFELVEGELVSKMGKKGPHVVALALVRDRLMQIFGPRFVLTETPIDVSPADNPTSEPEPDLIVLQREYAHVVSTNAVPGDLRLVVEVADTTLSYDLTTKARLYVRAGIGEYWVLDVPGSRLIVHRDPQEGTYRSVERYEADEAAAPLAAPHVRLVVRDLLPPPGLPR